MLTEEQIDKAVNVVEERIFEYAESVKAAEARIKDLEQHIAGGITGSPSMGGRRKSLSDIVFADENFKAMANRSARTATIKCDTSALGVAVKSTTIGESGSPQEPDNTLVAEDRIGGIVGGAFRSLNLLDFVPVRAASGNSVTYTRESSWTSNAGETAEAGTKPESDVSFELIDDPVRTVAHWFKTSRQVLDDSPALAGYLDERLRHGVRARLQAQIINGNGTSPNLAGITATGRHTDFTPQTGESSLDALNRAKYAIIANDFTPSFVLLNPVDWGSLERDKKSDDGYTAGEGGAVQYIRNGLGATVWGVPVLMSNDIPTGDFIMADSRAMQLSIRQDAMVEVFEQSEDDAIHNLVLMRGEMRAAFSVFLPAAVLYGSLTV